MNFTPKPTERRSIGGRSRGWRRADAPPRYERAGTGSMLDPLEAVIGRLLKGWTEIKAPRGHRDPAWRLRRCGVGGSGAQADGGAAAGRGCVRRSARAIGRAGDAGRLGGDAYSAADRWARAPCLCVDLLAALFGRVDGALHVRHDRRVVLGARWPATARAWRGTRARTHSRDGGRAGTQTTPPTAPRPSCLDLGVLVDALYGARAAEHDRTGIWRVRQRPDRGDGPSSRSVDLRSHAHRRGPRRRRHAGGRQPARPPAPAGSGLRSGARRGVPVVAMVAHSPRRCTVTPIAAR
jgi:hypothetical protein